MSKKINRRFIVPCVSWVPETSQCERVSKSGDFNGGPEQVDTTDVVAQLVNLVSKTGLIAIRRIFIWSHP